MNGSDEMDPGVTQCAECQHAVEARATIPAVDGRGRRCADHDACHDRKESRLAFAAA